MVLCCAEVSLEQSGERDSPASFSLLVEASQDVDSSQSTCPVEPGEDQEVKYLTHLSLGEQGNQLL